MTLFGLLLLFLAQWQTAPTAHNISVAAAPSVLAAQCQSCTTNSGVKFTSNTAGDTIVLVAVFNATSISSITDTVGNTWSATPDCSTTAAIAGYTVAYFHTSNIAAGSNNAISVTASGSVSFFTVLTTELSGQMALDTCSSTGSSGTGTSITSHVTPTASSGVLLGYGSAGTSISCTSPAVLASKPSPATGDIFCAQTSSGAVLQSVTVGQSTSGQMGAFSAAYKSANGQQLYMAQTAAGSGNGSSCANAEPVTWFNTAGNWGTGTGKIGAGTTVHLCGTVSSPLSFQGSGNVSAPITLLFESGASMQQPEWVTAAITFNGQSYATVDGGGTGVIESTGAGSTGTHAGSSCFQPDNNSANVTIQNITCGPLYARTTSSDPNQVGWGVSVPTGANMTIRNSTFHDAFYGIQVGGVNANGLQIYGNNIYNTSTGIAFGDPGTGNTTSNVQFYNNHIHDGANWDGTWSGGTLWNHNDGIHVWTSSGGTQNAPKIYGNQIDGAWGGHTTAFIFMEADVGPMINPLLYNNLIVIGDTNSATNGLIEMKTNITGGLLYNNTIDCLNGGGNGIHWEGGSATTAQNQAILNCTNAFASDGTGSMTHDYTSYWNTPSGGDTHIVTANPNFNASYVPPTSSPIATAGNNLSTTFTTDKNGITRPSTGGWTLGALQAQ